MRSSCHACVSIYRLRIADRFFPVFVDGTSLGRAKERMRLRVVDPCGWVWDPADKRESSSYFAGVWLLLIPEKK